MNQATNEATEAYRREAFRAYSIFCTKNKQYGNSIKETGVLGAVVELVAKNARLRQLVIQNGEWCNWSTTQGRDEDVEAVRDTLRDLVNYGVIGLMMLADNNGKGQEVE